MSMMPLMPTGKIRVVMEQGKGTTGTEGTGIKRKTFRKTEVPENRRKDKTPLKRQRNPKLKTIAEKSTEEDHPDSDAGTESSPKRQEEPPSREGYCIEGK